MEEIITYVGLDVHKKSIAVADGGLADEVRYLGLIDLPAWSGPAGLCVCVTRPAPAAMAFIAICRSGDTRAWWWRRR